MLLIDIEWLLNDRSILHRLIETDRISGLENIHHEFHSADYKIRQERNIEWPGRLSVIVKEVGFCATINDSQGRMAERRVECIAGKNRDQGYRDRRLISPHGFIRSDFSRRGYGHEESEDEKADPPGHNG